MEIVLCLQRIINPLQATLQHAINFLATLFATGEGYSCINTARSAFSSLIVLPGSIQFGSPPFVTRFDKGVFEVWPALPRYKDIWDVNKVFTFLAAWTLGEGLSLNCLSWKLTMLLVLLSGQRVQTLKALTLSSLTLTASKCLFTIGTPLKTNRPGHHLKSPLNFLHISLIRTYVLSHICRHTLVERLYSEETLISYLLATRNLTSQCRLTLFPDE